MQGAAGTQPTAPEVLVAGSPGQRANSSAETRRAAITEASANNYPSGLESAMESVPAQKLLPISHLKQKLKAIYVIFH